MDNYKSRKNYITLLSVVSAFAVVLLHSNGCFWSFSRERYWITANIIDAVFYFAVPIFFMISGVTLIDYHKKYSTKEYFKNRIKKTFIPFLVWSFIGLLFQIFYTKDIAISDINIKYLYNGIVNTSFVSIYWFFIPLFIIYLCIPLFSMVEDDKKIKLFKYLCVIGILFNSLFPFINTIGNFELSLPINIPVVSGYLLYPILGYLLDKKEFSKKERFLLYIISILGLLIHIIGTYQVSMEAGKVLRTFKGYNNIPSLMYSIGVFVFLKQIGNKITNYKIISVISKYTFSIYLMHWYLLVIMEDTFSINNHSIIYRLGAPLVVIPLCMIITYLLRKIPIIKRIVP